MLYRKNRKYKISFEEQRKFGITIGVFLMILGFVFFWVDKSGFVYLYVIGATFLISGIIIPVIIKPIYFIWMKFSSAIGWIMTRIILSALFYIFFTLIKLIAKIFGKKFLDLKVNKEQKSYWHYRDKIIEESDYEKQF